MAMKIRLRQQGRKNRQTFRVVLMDARNKRDGRYLEMLGWYDPFAKNENNMNVDGERVGHWLKLGAEISDSVKSLLATAAPEVLKAYNEKEIAKRTKLVAKRRAAKKGKTASAKVASPKASGAKKVPASAARAK